MLGVLGSAGAAICLAPCGSALGESNLGQAINAVTGTRLWASVFSLPGTILTLFCLFVFTRLLRRWFAGYCAAVRTPPRSPTDDATTPPAFSRWQRSPVSSRFFHRARPASGPSAGDHSQGRTDPEYAAHLAPIAFADRDRLPC
jgi:hypothetical protein